MHCGHLVRRRASPQSIAANTQGKFVVADNMNCELKVYDNKGRCLRNIPLLGNDEEAAVVRFRSVATDQNVHSGRFQAI